MKLPVIILLSLTLIVVGFSQEPSVTEKKQRQIFIWRPDCKICDRFTVDGNTYHVFENEKFKLLIRLFDAKKFLVATVGIQNKSDKRFEFIPSEANLVVFKKDRKKVSEVLTPMTPEETAKKIKKRGRWANFASALSGAFAKEQATVRDQYGNTVATVTAPNTNAQNRANQTIRNRQNNNNRFANLIVEDALRANTLFPKGAVYGNLYFKRKKSISVIIAVNINQTMYSVMYNGTKSKK